jgi:hypothetical protein
MRALALRRRYGRGRKPKFDEAIQQTAVKLIMGKRLELEVPGRPIMYAGSSREERRDPYWVEHPGGRIYYTTPEEAASYLKRHLGDVALFKAKVYDS